MNVVEVRNKLNKVFGFYKVVSNKLKVKHATACRDKVRIVETITPSSSVIYFFTT